MAPHGLTRVPTDSNEFQLISSGHQNTTGAMELSRPEFGTLQSGYHGAVQGHFVSLFHCVAPTVSPLPSTNSVIIYRPRSQLENSASHPSPTPPDCTGQSQSRAERSCPAYWRVWPGNISFSGGRRVTLVGRPVSRCAGLPTTHLYNNRPGCLIEDHSPWNPCCSFLIFSWQSTRSTCSLQSSML